MNTRDNSRWLFGLKVGYPLDYVYSITQVGGETQILKWHRESNLVGYKEAV